MNEKNAFLWVSEFERLTCPTPGSPHIPQRWGQFPATAQQDRPARPDAGHAAQVCTRYKTGRAG